MNDDNLGRLEQSLPDDDGIKVELKTLEKNDIIVIDCNKNLVSIDTEYRITLANDMTHTEAKHTINILANLIVSQAKKISEYEGVIKFGNGNGNREH